MSEKFFSGEVAFSQPVINIGSDKGNDIIVEGPSVGDFHAMMHYESNRWYITPLDTSKTTMCNGLSIGAKGSQLKSGDVLTIGDYNMTLMLNGINVDVFSQVQGNLSTDGSMSNQESNIQLVLNGTPPVEVDAGGSVEYELTVSNTGPLVANMQLQLQGVPSSWVQITPPVVNLNEGQKGNFLVRVNPPRVSSAKAGVYYIHFVVSSPNYQRETAAVDISLTVHPYTEYLLNGPMPRVLKLSHSNSSDTAELVVINNSNAAANFIVQSFDDASELQFAYARGGSGGVYQNQEMVTVQAGENLRVPMVISPKKIPFIGFSSRSHHYSVNVTPSDRPGDAQSVMGEVIIKPFIRTYVLLLIIAVLLVGVVFGLQPYIHQFDGANGKHTVVVLNGNSAEINWRVSSFASKVTLNDGSGEKDVAKIGSTFVSPNISTTYELKAENFLSRLLGMEYRKTIRVLSMPGRPTIRLLQADKQIALYNQPVKLTWAVESDADQVNMSVNKQSTQIEPDNYSGESSQGFTADTLVSLRAENASGYEMKSLFIHVAPDQINLTRFAVWVRPNGAAIPNNNDTTRTSRWSALELSTGSDSNISKPASVNPQPAAQSNTLEIPDNYSNSSAAGQSYSPEQQSLNGPAAQPTPYTYTPPEVGTTGTTELLVSPVLNRQDAQGNPNGVQQTEIITSAPVQEPTAPQTSPEGSGNGYNRDFSIKFAEVVEDPTNESGYRVIEYFPDYQIQPGEQILIEWRVEGVTQVKIDNLSSDNLKSSGGEYANPEKTTTYVLHAEVGEVKQDYSLPVRVAGEPEDGEGSGKNCELKASATTLKEPGTVMLSWTGAGGNRVQLVSSAKAEADAADAEKQKEQEAKEKGETYEKPDQPGPLSGGTIGDWLQPSGFMRINVENQTTFVLNAYDGGGNVICTKSVEVKLDGGNDKQDISKIEGASFKITRIADENNVEQKFYAVGQTVQYTVAFEGFPKDKEPSGNVVISDGNASCTVTLPVTSCSFQAKKAGNLTVTAVYSGDNNYKKTQTTAKEVVIDKLESTTELQAALKPGANMADVITQLKFDTENAYDLIPTGTITFTAGSGTCDLDIVSDKLTCDGTVVENPEDGYWWTITNMLLADANADRITAAYKGDNYFSPSTSTAVLFYKVPTTITIPDDPTPYKPDVTHADFTTELSWELPWDENDSVYELVKDLKPTGTITFTPMSNASSGSASNEDTANCVYDISAGTLSCEGTVVKTDYSFAVSQMLVSNNSDRVRVNYSGDSLYGASSFTKIFTTMPTTIEIGNDPMPTKYPDGKISLNVEIKPESSESVPNGKTIKGKITLKSGDAATCVYNIDQNTFENCSGDPVDITDDGKFEFAGLAFTGTTGNNITAEYSGDSYFRASISQAVPFRVITKIDTQKNITTAFKTDASHVTVVSELTWEPDVDDDKVPTGTITYTIGTGTCVLDFSDLEEPKLTCEYEKGKEIISPVEAEEAAKGKIVFTIENMQIADQTADRITAAYSGDAAFNPSTSTAYMFSKVDTVTKVLEAYKPVASSANIIASLTRVEEDWEKAGCTKDGIICPEMTGTITYTFGGQTCVLDIVKETMNCSGTVSVKDNEYSILNVLLSNQNADRVSITYSGDAFYNASTASETLFNRVLTETVISDAEKRTEDEKRFADFTVEVTWLDAVKDDAAPTGTLTFTYGSETCDIDIVTGEGVGEHPCEASRISKYGSRFVIEGMTLGDEDPDSITAAYSGDSAFRPSTSQPWKFDMIDTEIEITRAFKPDDTMANLVALLTWDEEEAGDKKPTGTVTFIASNSMVDSVRCVHELGTDDPNNFSCRGTLTDNNYEFTIENMPIGEISVDRIRAEYSGDDSFNPSSSKMVKFKIVGTAIEIVTAEKTADSVVAMTTELTWDEFVSGGVRPSGTIKFTSGTRTCTLNISGDPFKFTDCDGSAAYTYSETDRKLSITISNLPMIGAGDTIKAEYSGSGAYLKSESPEAHFGKFSTDLEIDGTGTFKSDSSHVTVEAYLTWKKTAEGQPTGTVKYTIGSSVCTLNIRSKTLDCESGDITVDGPVNDPNDDTNSRYHLIIKDVMFEGEADRVKAEYSGDSMFNPSSDSSLFKTLETETIIINDETYKPYRPDAGYANFNVKITWDEAQSNGRIPGGTITFTPVNSEACVYTIGGRMSCEGTVKAYTASGEEITDFSSATEIDHFEIRNMLMSNSTSDRIKAEYKGDGFFEPSASTTVLFDMSDTATRISSPAKSPEGVVEMTVAISPTKAHPDGREPLGTLKIISGSKTCTLDLSTTSQRFSDCEGVVELTSDGTYHITELQMGAETSGTSIRAEYSGDSYFLASTSPTIDFVKVDTELSLTNVYKPGSLNMANLNVTLSWDKVKADGKAPSGTIRFTIGSDTCAMTRLENDIPGFNCSSENTVITRTKSEPADSDKWSYTWTISNILLSGDTADRAKAEYTGDAVFNGSASDTVMFKTVPTQITVSSAFKRGTDYADISALLRWETSEADGRKPSGTVKFTAGSGSCTLDIETKVLSCEPKTGSVSEDRTIYSVTGMLLDDKTADRVQVEYSGDGFFEPSVSSKFLFQTIPTDLVISDASIRNPGFISLTAKLHWVDETGLTTLPSGTIKFTSGTGTCTLDISGSSPRFTDCDGQAAAPVKDENNLTFTITNMYFGGKAGDTVKAEYSGDGLFLASASETLDFEHQDTILEITEAYKPEAGLVNSTITLSWEKEKAGGEKPSGTIKLLIGGSTCALNMEDNSFNCSGESTTITSPDKNNPVEYTRDSVQYLSYSWKFEKILLSDTSADRMKAEYSGDGFFNESASVTVLFKTMPTEITIKKGDKKSSGLLDLDMTLKWIGEAPGNSRPEGNIKLTSGTRTCTLNISGTQVRLTDCQGDQPSMALDGTTLSFIVRNLNMGGTTGESIKAEYSGNSIFLASASDSLFFSKIDTTLTIAPNEIYKTNEGLVTMLTSLSWEPQDDGRKPTGTITYTIGSDTCVLDVVTKAFSCSGTDTVIDGPGTGESGTFEWHLKKILLSNANVDRVKAVYSGDAAFNPSTSLTVLFKTIETSLAITDQSRLSTGNVSFTTTVSWADTPPVKDRDADPQTYVTPAGSIKFTAGSATCNLVLSANPLKLDCDPNATVTLQAADPDDPQKSVYLIENLNMGSVVETIKADYSGDGCFMPSESNTISFIKMNTTTTIDSSKITRVDEQTVTFNVTLASDHTDADVDGMTGTIKFTIGSDTCNFDITTEDFNCRGENTSITAEKNAEAKKITWTFQNVVLSSGNNADRMKAEYGGNDMYNPSSSAIVFFTKVTTYLAIPEASKSNDGLITMTGEFSWDPAPAGKLPAGTIKFLSGSATCTLNITADPLRFSDCAGDITVTKDTENRKYTYTVTGMDMGTNVGDDVKLEYAGDGTFQPSTSDSYSFTKVNTTLTIDANETFRSNDFTATVLATLKWKKADADGKTPTGTVKFTIGADVCTLDISTNEFSCYGASTDVAVQPLVTEDTDEETGLNLTIKNIMLSASNNADRVKADFSGDAIFNPSSSSVVLFKTIETTLDIYEQKKLPTGLVNLNTELSWEDVSPTGKTPAGTIKYTSGTAVCTLNLTTQKFTDCDGNAEITFAEKTATIVVTGLNFGRNVGNVIKAEYSGDGCYLASVSSEEELVFTKLIPELVITRAYKPGDTKLVNMIVGLEWGKADAMDKEPTGTITFTMGSNSCALTIATKAFTCSGPDTEIERTDNEGSYVWTITNALLSANPAEVDRVSAKYSGDEVFETVNSNLMIFRTVETESVIRNSETEWPYKPAEGYASFITSLTWDTSDEALTWDMEDGTTRTPTGTITFSPMEEDKEAGKCVLTISNRKLNCEGTVSGSVTDQYEISRMLLSNFKSDRIKAEYSGDGFFTASTSTVVLFKTSDTTTAITNAEKSQDGKVTMNLAVTGTVEHPEGIKPLGTIKITSGSKTCTLDIKNSPSNAKFTDCSGTVRYDTDNDLYKITDLEMGKDAGTTINAVYSGDNAFFNGSTSPSVDFLKIDTFLVLIEDNVYKTAPDRATVETRLSWSSALSGSKRPTGTITFTIGSDSCKYDLTTRDFSCEGTDTWISVAEGTNGRFTGLFENIVLSGTTADRVKASYSGDSIFNPSESLVMIFKTVPTTLSIGSDAYRPTEGYASFDSQLFWNTTDADGRTPTGSIKFTVGSGSCTLDLSTQTLSCESTRSTYDSATGAMVIRNMLLDDKTADRIKAEYSGDGFFLPSASTTVLFKKADTTTSISNMTKTTDGVINMTLTVHPGEAHPDGRMPLGTVKVTSGSKTCTLDITSDPQKFTDCNFDKIEKSGEHYVITGLVMGADAGNSIRAEYSGDSYFNGSISPTVDFIKLDTTISIEKAYKSAPAAAELTVKLGWTKDEKASETPRGTIKLTIGSDTCTLNIQTKVFDCASPDTVIDDPITTDVSYEWHLHNVLLSGTTADRVKAEYSGDATFNASSSTTVMLKTVPTTIVMMTAEKPSAGYANITSELTWDNTLNTENRTPTGTVKFTVGSGSCTLDLVTKALSCEPKTGTVDESVEGKRSIEILSMLLDDSSADRIYAEYSGDGYFEPSTSTKILLQKRDVDLVITKITDEAGVEHTSFYTPGQTVRVVTNLDGALDDPAPTGTISVTVDTATCTITLPQKSCLLTLPKTTGENITVNAVYSGDNGYNGDDDHTSITISDPKQLTISIDKITDTEGVEQEAFAFEQEVIVLVSASDVDEDELPTGNITVKIGTSTATCPISYPDPASCRITLPNAADTYDVTAVYAGNTYYKSAEAAPKKVIVDKYDINFRIDTILNQVTNTETGMTENHTQPYYVYDQNANAGQLMQVCVAFDNPAHGAPTGTVVIYDEDHDDGEQYVTLSSGTYCGTFNVRKYTGEITLTAAYSGDSVYVSKKAQKSMTVQNRIDPHFTLDYALVQHHFTNIGIIVFGFYGIPENLPDEVSYKKDTTRVPETTQTVEFKITNGTDTYEISYDLGTGAVSNPEHEYVWCEENQCMLISDQFPTYVEEHTTVSAKYGSNNRYFFDSEDIEIKVDLDEGIETKLALSDVLKIDNPVEGSTNGHLFLKAELSYDKWAADLYKEDEDSEAVKPEGSLLIKFDDSSEEKECDFNLNLMDFSCGTVTIEEDSGTETPDENKKVRVKFEVRNINVPENSGIVHVQYKPVDETHYFAESNEAEEYITTEDRPEITIPEEGVRKTTHTTADLEFTVEEYDLEDKYDVYDLVKLGSKSDEEGAVEKTCTFRIFSDGSMDWVDGPCTGTITRDPVDDSDGHTYTYTIKNFSGIVAKEDTELSVTVMNDYLSDIKTPWVLAEYPVAVADYWIEKVPTTLKLTNVLKYNETHGYVTFDIEYDEDSVTFEDVYPGGKLRLRAVGTEGMYSDYCLFDLNSPTNDPVEGCEGATMRPEPLSDGKVHFVIRNVPVEDRHTGVEMEYLGDDYFKKADLAEADFTDETPQIVINNAVYTTDKKVYADFTVTGIDGISAVYGLNERVRFGSAAGGKYCTYYLVNEEFETDSNPDCAGELVIDGTTYTLRGLAGLYTDADTSFSVNVFTKDVLTESEYPTATVNYGKLETGFMLSNELKVMNKYTFLTADFNYENEITGRYNVKPSGIFTFTTSAGTCSFNIKTKETSAVNSEGETTEDRCEVIYDELAEMNGKIHFIVRKLTSNTSTRAITVGYSGDDFLSDINLTRDIDIDAHPVIAIKEGSAVKTSLTKANVTFQVVAAGYYADIYESFFNQIKLYSHDGRASYIDIRDIMVIDDSSGTASFFNGDSGTITWAKEGDTVTFTVTDWSGPINNEDTTCTVELVSHDYLAESEYPKDDEPFGHNTGWTNLTVSDVYSAAGSHVYLTAVLSYDPDIADAYITRPSGTLTITGNNGGAPKVCKFGLWSPYFWDVDTGYSCGTVEVDEENHKATFVVRTYEGAAGTTVSRVQVQYNGDEYFNQSALVSANSNTESPTVEISYLLRSRESDGSGNGYVMFTVDGIDENSLAGKYNVYPYIRLMRHTDSSAADYCRFDRAAKTLTDFNDCHADEIIVDGNTYIFKNLNGTWNGQKIIQPRHIGLEVSLYPDTVRDRWSVTSYPMHSQPWLDRLNTSLSLPEIVKVSDRHVVIKAELTSDLNSLVVADAFGVSPTGTIHFNSGGLDCLCDIDAGTCTGGCVAEVTKTVGTWPITMLVRNPAGTADVGTQIDAKYNSDRLFRYSDMTGTFVNGAPTITIDSAQKLSNTKANVTVTVHGNDYVEYYSSVYDQIRLAAHDGEYSFIDNISEILSSSSTSGSATLSQGSGAVTWTKSGNDVTFTVTNWTGRINAEDTQCTAWLLADGLTEDQYPKAGPKTFTHTKGQVTLSFDGNVLNEHNDNYFMDVVLDYDPQTAAGFQKPKGRLTLRGYSVSTVCVFDLNQNTVSCQQDGCRAEILSVDETAHKAIIRIRGFHSWGSNYMRVSGDNDDFYTYNPKNGNVVRVTPEVTVNHAFKGPHQVGYAQITIKSTADLEKFKLYPRVMLYSGKNDDDAHNAAFELRAENPQFESPVTGTITRSYDPDTYTYTFMIRDMKDMIGADDTYLKAAANDTEIGSTVKSDAIDYETIRTEVSLSDPFVLIDGSNYEHAFGKINFSFGELARTFNLWPDGWVRVGAEANNTARYGYINVSDPSKTVGTDDFGKFSFTSAKDETNHTYQVTMKNMSVRQNASSIRAVYNMYPLDGDMSLFQDQFYIDTIFSSYATQFISATRVKPTISITEAKKYPVESGSTFVPMIDVSFTVDHLSDLASWGIFDKIRLSSSDNTVYSEIDLSTNRLTDSSGTVSRNGDTFTVTGWNKLPASANSVAVYLVSSNYSDINWPSSLKNLSKPETTVSLKDVYGMDSAYFMTMVLNYEPSGPAPTGTFEIEILGSSASCTVNLRSNQSTCSDDIEVRRIDGRVEVLVSGWMPTGAGTFTNYRLLYNGDDYYADAYSELYNSVQSISKPTVQILSANRNGTVTFKINGYDSVYSKYPIIDRVGLESYGIGSSYPKYISILDLPVTDSDITIKRSGDTFTVTNFPGAGTSYYWNCEVSLNSLNNKYWREGTIYHHIGYSDSLFSTSPLSSGSPVTLSVTLGGE